MRTPEFPDDAAEQPQDRQDLQPDGTPETTGDQAAGIAPGAQGPVAPHRSRFTALRQAGEDVRAAWRDARSARPRREWPRVYWQALVSHAGKRQAQRIALSALIVTLLLTGSGGLFLTTVLFPHLFGPTVTHSSNTLDQFKNGGNAYGQTGSQTPTPHAPLPPGGGALSPAQAPSSSAATVLQPVIISLDPSKHLNNGSQSAGSVTRYLASDQVLEVGLADTSIDLTSATPSGAAIPVYTPAPKPTPPPAPKGPITQATPTPASAPHTAAAPATSVSSAAAATTSANQMPLSSTLSQDAQAHLATLAPHASGPFKLELIPSQAPFYSSHNGAWLGAFMLRVLDGSRKELKGVKLKAPLTLRFHYQPGELSGLNASDIRLVWTATGDEKAKKPAQYVPVTVDTTTSTMTASVASLQGGQLALAASSTDAGVASSEHLTMAGNSGDVQFSVPLQIPPAAGGLAPNLQLTYGSGGPNGRHGDNATAPPTGDGWNLSLGSITYDASYPSNNVYFFNGIGGISEPLLCCATDSQGKNYFLLHHHPTVRIQVEDNSTNPSATGKCFHVWTLDGLYYELGCTSDSRRTNVSGGALQYIEWDVNKVQRLADNGGSGYLQQYTVSYWQDMSTAGGVNHTRDAYMKEIDYNFVGGVAQARILFDIHWPSASVGSGSPQAIQYTQDYNCWSGPPTGYHTTQRCDDPVDQSGWTAAPLVYSTITLDRITPQLWNGETWKTARTYDLNYTDNGFTQCWDGFAGTWHACAGEHTLIKIQETPYQNNVAMPSRQPLVFTYTPLTRNDYFDLTVTNWNGGNFNDQDWWAYLTGFTDKQTGASGSIAYKQANANTHGVPSGSNVLDPFACTAVNCWTGSTNPPEDRQWQRQAVYQITDTGGSPNTTTTYAYTLKQPCGAGCTQDTWIPPNQYNTCGGVAQPPQSTMQSCLLGNFSNYWMQEYTGFETVTTTHPDNSTTWEQYYAGAGWGTNDWDGANQYRDSALVTDSYQGSPAGTPLQETRSTYLVDACPVTNPSLGWQLFITPYIACFIHETQRDTYLGGNSSSNPAVPKRTQTWTYSLGGPAQNHFTDELASTTTATNDALVDSFAPSPNSYGSTQPSMTTTYDYVSRDGALETPATPYEFFLPAQVRVKDNTAPSNTYWRCSQSRYDGLGYATGLTSSLKAGLGTQTDTFQSCAGGAPTNPLTTTQGYDPFGQPLVSQDADANAGDATHKGCAVTGSDTLWLVAPSGASSFTSCTRYDGTYHTFPTGSANAKNQSSATAFDYLQGVPTSSTDANGQLTTFAGPVYENASGGDIYSQATLPAQPSGWGNPSVPWTSRAYSYSFCASATNATTPCLETDTVRQSDGTNLLVSRQMYDRDGRLIETRSTGPTAGADVVTFTTYDDQAHKVFASQPCVVPALSTTNGGQTIPSLAGYIAPTQNGNGTGAWIDPSVSGTNCSSGTVKGTTTYEDALGRVIATDDAVGTGVGTSGSGCLLPGSSFHHTSCVAYFAVIASAMGGLPNTDNEPYLQAFTIDANLHQSASYTDALGRTAYTQQFTGASQYSWGSGINSYAVTSATYDASGAQRTVKDAAGNVTTWTYNNTVGRLDSLADPDRGSESYSYDANGNVTQTADARGAGSSSVTLLGETTVEPDQDFEDAGTMAAFKYIATNSGRADQVSVYLDGANQATQVLVGLYDADASGNPNTLLGQATLAAPTDGAWNSVSLSSVTLTAGHIYFIAILSPVGNGPVYYRDTASGGDDIPTSQATNLGALPSAFGPVNHWAQRGSAYISQQETSGGVTYAGYDGLNRQLWRNTTNSSSGAYVTYTYDDTTAGNVGIGRLTNESFTGTFGGGSQTGTYSYGYDARGEVSSSTLTVLGSTYTTTAQYTELGSLKQQVYPVTNETVSYTYTGQGLLNSLQTSANPNQSNKLVDNFGYSATNGLLTGARLGGTYNYALSYDALLRPQTTSVTKVSNGATLYSETDGYDPVGNVASVNTTLPTGTDNQGYCYDEQNRLTWAGTSGTKPCGGSVTAGTLTAAAYTNTFTYDTLDRLTSGPAGSYTYGDGAHKHAATQVGSGYTAKYDASGNMTCRAPSSSLTCSGTITGANLTYDNEGRLIAWQNAQSSPASTDSFLYDGEGNRVAQQSVNGAVTTQSVYVGSLLEARTVTGGSGTGNLVYYSANGSRIAMMAGGALSYLVGDHLGSSSLVLDAAGNAVASQLFSPYGALRYSNGTMPTDYGFTGQRADSATGLDFYNARYYDPAIGQFASADKMRDGQSGYAYVRGNPTSKSDPTGHRVCELGYGGCSSDRGSQENTGTACDASCAYVKDTFRDQRTRKLIKLINLTVIGSRTTEYLLYMGDRLGGDNFVTWKHFGTDYGSNEFKWGYTLEGGTIQLNADTLATDPKHRTETGVIVMAGTLVHEAVHSYLFVALGLRGNSMHQEYLASIVEGVFQRQLLNCSCYSGYPNDVNYAGGTSGGATGTEAEYEQFAGDHQTNYGDKPIEGPFGDTDRIGWAWDESHFRIFGGQAYWYEANGPRYIGATHVGTPPNPMQLEPWMVTGFGTRTRLLAALNV